MASFPPNKERAWLARAPNSRRFVGREVRILGEVLGEAVDIARRDPVVDEAEQVFATRSPSWFVALRAPCGAPCATLNRQVAVCGARAATCGTE
jgi:hypothetical protein